MDPKYFVWLFLLLGSQIVPVALWYEARPRIAADPSLRPGYRRIIHGLAVWLAAPWLAMGLGCLIGDVPFPDAFFRPGAHGPWAWLFWVVAFGSFAYGAWWAAWGGGAEDLARHPGVLPLIPAWPASRLKALLVGLMALFTLWNVGYLVWMS